MLSLKCLLNSLMEIPHRQLDINMEFREKVRARDIIVSCISVQMALASRNFVG